MIKNKNQNQNKPQDKDKKKKELQIIGEGGYGCVFRPEIRCNTLRPGDSTYVSKVQLASSVSDSEIKIGKIIQTIPNYPFYFAPILENCPLSIKTVQTYKMDQMCEEIDKEIKQPNTTSQSPFVSNKIQYIGKTDLGDYINELLLICTQQLNIECKKRSSWHQYMKKHVYSHLYVLRGIQKLSEKGIAHLDIKSNNIMYHKKNNAFIFIDYGFSTIRSDLEASVYETRANRPFGILTDNYIPWCIDIMLLSYIARQIKMDAPSSSYVDPEKFNAKPSASAFDEMKQLCSKYVVNSLDTLCTEKEQREFAEKLVKWMQGFAGKTYKEIWTKLLANYNTWDNYSICAMYLYEWLVIGIFKEVESLEKADETNIMVLYIRIIKSVLLSVPDKRDDPAKTFAAIVKLFSKIKKSQYESMVNQFSKIVSSPEHIEKIKRAHEERKIQDQQIEDKMKKKK